MKFDIEKAFNFVLNQDESRYERAIRLFELQVSITSCEQRDRKLAPAALCERLTDGFIIDVPRDILRAARVHALLKLLEHLHDKEPRTGIARGFERFKNLLENPEYQRLLWRLESKYGGFERVRHVMSCRALDARLKEASRKAAMVANVADFSLRASLDPKKPRRKFGRTMALDLIPGFPDFIGKLSSTTLGNWYRPLAPVLGFLHLIYIQKFAMIPLQISKIGFSRRLLEATDDRRSLLDFLAHYEAVCLGLSKRNYELCAITLKRPMPLPTVRLSLAPLPPDIVQTVY